MIATPHSRRRATSDAWSTTSSRLVARQRGTTEKVHMFACSHMHADLPSKTPEMALGMPYCEVIGHWALSKARTIASGSD
eukprot:3721512-Pleurochrysis_carterae.AAC.1